MKAALVILLVCVSAALSAQVRPKLFPEHPVFAGKRRSPKIVGGEEASPHSIPYQVGLFLDGYFCGGSLIGTRWVLTAAHCGELTSQPTVVLGAHKIQDSSEQTQVAIQGRKPIVHESWDESTLRNDISLIELPSDVQLNQNIGLVDLASGSNTYAGKSARASGWGLAYDGSQSLAPALRQVVSTILTNQQCQNEFGSGIPVYDTIICLDGSDGKSTCSGDSGGPLVDTQSGQQIGLTSYGVSIGCEAGYPAAFTRVSSYASWIQSHTGL